MEVPFRPSFSYASSPDTLGNSLGLRIPKDLAGRFRLTEGARVEMQAEGDHIVISMPVRSELSEMLAGLTPAAMSDAFDWGDDQGREAVD